MKNQTSCIHSSSNFEDGLPSNTANTRLITKEEVISRTSIKNTTLYKLIKQGDFPKQVKRGRRSYWWEHEVRSYMESLPRAECQPKTFDLR